MKRTSLFLFGALILLAIGAGVWYWGGPERRGTAQKEQKQAEICGSQANVGAEDASILQTKETEFFSIQFPPGWCWLELRDGPRVFVLTYHSAFDLTRNADIGVAGGANLIMGNDKEVIVTFNGSPTAQNTDGVGKSAESALEAVTNLSAQMQRELGAQCTILDDNSRRPIQACSYKVNDKKVRQYHIANNESVIYMTAYRSVDNESDDGVLDMIADSLILK